MNNTLLSTTVQIPSRFGMPTCAPSFGEAVRGTDARGTTVPAAIRDWTSVIDGTDATGTKGHLGLVPAYFPGTTAWRPPTC